MASFRVVLAAQALARSRIDKNKVHGEASQVSWEKRLLAIDFERET